MLPLQQASAAEPRFAAAAVWPSLAAQTGWVPHADSPPEETHTHTRTKLSWGFDLLKALTKISRQ